jgi:hypothetical protein
MPRTCTVCGHSAREEIEIALMSKGSLRDIAGQFGLSKTALDRHRHEHILDRILTAAVQKDDSRAVTLFNEAEGLLGKASALLLNAEASGDPCTALAGVREARGCIELLAKLQTTAVSTESQALDARSFDKLTGVEQPSGLGSGRWMVVCELLSDVLGRWPHLANTVAGGLRDMNLADAAEIILSGIPESMRTQRESIPDRGSRRMPSQPLTTDDLAAIARVIKEELRDFDGPRNRIAARLTVIEAQCGPTFGSNNLITTKGSLQ